jgi:signal transduction histidine kinase/ActR/RegA family two-component response regulator
MFWRKDGSGFPIEFISTPIREDGQQIGSVFVFKDITERRRLEEQVRQSQKLEAVGRLAGGVAHDFNNLLTVVSGYAELLAVNPTLDRRGQEAVAEVKAAADRAISLTRQLLAFSRNQMLQPRAIDLNGVIAEINKLIRRLIGEDIALTTHLAADLGPVTADPGQVEQVILNLAVNARDAMPRGGALTITTGNATVGPAAQAQPGLPPGRYALLTVADTGCGMDEATKARIFEPFFTTKEPGKGTGLGLAVVHGIVAQSGGHIDVQTAPGRGTTFRILLPQAEGPVPPPAAARAAPGKPAGGTETVLLVEDEDAVRAFAARVLQTYGYQVLEARDGAEAQQVAARDGRAPDLMVTDVVMPGLSGLELARRLGPARPGMKVLFMSGHTDDAITRRGVLSPEASFLHKPFTPEELAGKVREVLDRAPSAAAATGRGAT